MYSLNKGIIENSLIKLKSLDWFIISLMLLLSAISLIVLSSLDTGDKNLVEKHFLRIVFSKRKNNKRSNRKCFRNYF